METMYERIKRMTMYEMKEFIYWVYMNGNKDGEEYQCDSGGFTSYFGGYMLNKLASEVMPHDNTDDLWDDFKEIYGIDIREERD